MEKQEPAHSGEDRPKLKEFFALREDGGITILPRAEYAATAVHAFRSECEENGRAVPDFQMIFDESQYANALEAILSALNDSPVGKGPTYVAFSRESQTCVFPHFSVTTEDGIRDFVESFPTTITNGVKISVIVENWPASPGT